MLAAGDQGVTVEVWVVAGASRDEVTGVHDDALRIRTTAQPEGGRANDAVARLVAQVFGRPRAQVVSGHGSRRKRVHVEGITLAEAERVTRRLTEPR
jgi:uncharacterized protein